MHHDATRRRNYARGLADKNPHEDESSEDDGRCVHKEERLQTSRIGAGTGRNKEEKEVSEFLKLTTIWIRYKKNKDISTDNWKHK